MQVLSLFSGIGAFEKAIKNLGIHYELIAYCEIDKHASRSFSAIHNVPESMNLNDIRKVDEKALTKNIDLITYGFPCQDISSIGKQQGLFNEDGTQTRSGLFFDAIRIIREVQPRVAIAENVKNLTSKKFNAQFQMVMQSLEEAGYNNYFQIKNLKDFGIPQNRERVFIVSIRKDIDTGSFKFPEGFPSEIKAKDFLEDVVDGKYYLEQYERKTTFLQYDWHTELLDFCVEMAKSSFPFENKKMFLIDRMDLIEREEKINIAEQQRNQYYNHLENICDLYTKTNTEIIQIYSLNISQPEGESIDYMKERLQELFEGVNFCE